MQVPTRCASAHRSAALLSHSRGRCCLVGATNLPKNKSCQQSSSSSSLGTWFCVVLGEGRLCGDDFSKGQADGTGFHGCCESQTVLGSSPASVSHSPRDSEQVSRLHQASALARSEQQRPTRATARKPNRTVSPTPQWTDRTHQVEFGKHFFHKHGDITKTQAPHQERIASVEDVQTGLKSTHRPQARARQLTVPYGKIQTSQRENKDRPGAPRPLLL